MLDNLDAPPHDMTHHTARSPAQRYKELLKANIWLGFLIFPVLSVLVDDLSSARKTAAVGIVVLFAVVHVAAYRELIRHEQCLETTMTSSADNSWRWFVTLVTLNVVGLLIGSWSMLGIVPFIVSFAMFHFSWRIAGAASAISLGVVLALPAVGGVLRQSWPFSVVVVTVGAVTALVRFEEQTHGEQEVLRTELAVSHERDRMARDVHDVLGHSLTVVILKTQVCDRLIEKLAQGHGSNEAISQAKEQLAEIESVSRRALAEIRNTVTGLRTADLSDELAAAHVVLADADVDLTVNGETSEVPAQYRSVVAWVVREAMTNIVRHAQASHCTIDVGSAAAATDEHVVLRVADDGVGIGDNPAGNGLVGVHERAAAAGVTLRVTSQVGTEIELAVPADQSRV